jgi:uncharacterized damage-inducible protein DinB
MTWIAPTPEPVDGPMTGADRPMLEGYLAHQRATLLNICAGLTGDQLATRPLASSNLSLLGLIRHLSKVERIWFRIRAAREDVAPMFDPAQGKDVDFDDLDAAEAQVAVARIQEEWQRCDEAVAGVSFDATLLDREGAVLSLRFTYLHVIAEYARHNGHADLLREAIDGVTAR